MIMSRRARRMQRHHKRAHSEPGLNLVSLIDVFTLLVFFLLISSGQLENVPSSKTVKLPSSVSEQTPENNLVLIVNNDNIFMDGRLITSTQDVLSSSGEIIKSLHEELKSISERQSLVSTQDPASQNAQGRQITIMGDKEISYALLKKILVTCADANYFNISLAVMKKPANGANL